MIHITHRSKNYNALKVLRSGHLHGSERDLFATAKLLVLSSFVLCYHYLVNKDFHYEVMNVISHDVVESE